LEVATKSEECIINDIITIRYAINNQTVFKTGVTKARILNKNNKILKKLKLIYSLKAKVFNN
jgi:hypothetical protein